MITITDNHNRVGPIWPRRRGDLPALYSRVRMLPQERAGQFASFCQPNSQYLSCSSASLTALAPQCPETDTAGLALGKDPWEARTRARSHCRFAPPTHPLHTRTTKKFGTSVSEKDNATEPYM
jgi:hypothetical protein